MEQVIISDYFKGTIAYVTNATFRGRVKVRLRRILGNKYCVGAINENFISMKKIAKIQHLRNYEKALTRSFVATQY